MGLAATTWVPMGAQVPVLSPNDHPNPSQGRQKGFGKRRISEILQVSLNSLHNGKFRGFWGGHGSGYMGLAATTWVPMGAQVPVLSLNHHPNPSQGRPEGFRKSRILEILRVSLNSLIQRENSLVLTSKGPQGGATGGTQSSDLRPPPWVRGSMYKKKVAPDLGPNPHTAPRIRKEVLDPPRHPPPPPKKGKKGYPGTGG